MHFVSTDDVNVPTITARAAISQLTLHPHAASAAFLIDSLTHSRPSPKKEKQRCYFDSKQPSWKLRPLRPIGRCVSASQGSILSSHFMTLSMHTRTCTILYIEISEKTVLLFVSTAILHASIDHSRVQSLDSHNAHASLKYKVLHFRKTSKFVFQMYKIEILVFMELVICKIYEIQCSFKLSYANLKASTKTSKLPNSFCRERGFDI